MTKSQLEGMIADMRKNLLDTKDSAKWAKGPVNDAIQIMVPMLEDQINIIQGVLDLMNDTQLEKNREFLKEPTDD